VLPDRLPFAELVETQLAVTLGYIPHHIRLTVFDIVFYSSPDGQSKSVESQDGPSRKCSSGDDSPDRSTVPAGKKYYTTNNWTRGGRMLLAQTTLGTTTWLLTLSLLIALVPSTRIRLDLRLDLKLALGLRSGRRTVCSSKRV
jgi:hypothetical protein